MPLTIHGAPSRGMGFDFFNKFLHVHTPEHPFAILIQFTHMVFEGVFVRFPKLRVAFLEAGCGWLPYMMDRMDEEMEKPYRVQAPLLKQKPSELIRNGQIWTTRKSFALRTPAIQSEISDVAVGLSARAAARHV
jgi:predicted TIM-barrel fold metal-dependent hydrolase